MSCEVWVLPCSDLISLKATLKLWQTTTAVSPVRIFIMPAVRKKINVTVTPMSIFFLNIRLQ